MSSSVDGNRGDSPVIHKSQYDETFQMLGPEPACSNQLVSASDYFSTGEVTAQRTEHLQMRGSDKIFFRKQHMD